MADTNLLILIFGGSNGNTLPTLVQFRPNPSMQIGDAVYKVSTPSLNGGITTADANGSSTLEKLGTIMQIRDWNDENGPNDGDYGNIGGDQNTGIAYYIKSIDLDGDGSFEGSMGPYFFSSAVNGLGSYAIVIDSTGYTAGTQHQLSDYYFFAKDNSVNLTSITGYYAEVEFKNNSTKKAELFATACDVVESSK
jgi:hypothetical protein